MDTLVSFLLNYGYWGMFLAAFLAGSFFPFSSEAVMTGLVLAGLNVWSLMVYSIVGNTLGGLFNYGVGRLGNEKWVFRLFRTKPEKIERAKKLIARYGIWMGLLSWIPILGSVITITMGLLHLNFWKSALTIFLGKALRYLVLSLILAQI